MMKNEIGSYSKQTCTPHHPLWPAGIITSIPASVTTSRALSHPRRIHPRIANGNMAGIVSGKSVGIYHVIIPSLFGSSGNYFRNPTIIINTLNTHLYTFNQLLLKLDADQITYCKAITCKYRNYRARATDQVDIGPVSPNTV